MSVHYLLIAAWTTRNIAVGATAGAVVFVLAGFLWKSRRKKGRGAIPGTALGVFRRIDLRPLFRLPLFRFRHPFAKYVVLSVIAHFVLAIWVCTASLLEVPTLPAGPNAVVVELGDDLSNDNQVESPPWDQSPTDPIQAPSPELATEAMDDLELLERPLSLATEHIRAGSPLANLDSMVPEPSAPQPLAQTPAPQPIKPVDIVEAESQVVPPAPASAPEANPAASALSDLASQQLPTLAEQPTTVEEAQALAGQDDTAKIEDVNLPSNQPLTVETAMTTVSATTSPSLAPPPREQEMRSLQPVTSPWGKGRARLPNRQTAVTQRSDGRTVPSLYRDRQAEDRLAIARARGGSAETEAAVRSALAWLAAHQSVDGRWDASRFGSGRPTTEGGQDRQQAGLNADTGITGLAVLAFLGAGHTHQRGDYQQTLRDGIDFLLRAQQRRSDGSLVGNAGGLAAMYCHGIATLALSECYALTGDSDLRNPLHRAIAFSLAAQHPVTGGWRYQPQQPGDTSQLGWQLMALTSAHYGGIQIPRTTWSRAAGFLDSVGWGSHGGLASYRPGERPSTAMTAEALICRIFLGVPPTHPLMNEGANYLMNDLPGSGRVNYYYWYYGTLALYHLQDERWNRWNSAVTTELLRRQRTTTSLAGSWDADSVWGTSGGRVYTTSLAALTLEVYYRYRPRTQPTQRRAEQTAWKQGGTW